MRDHAAIWGIRFPVAASLAVLMLVAPAAAFADKFDCGPLRPQNHLRCEWIQDFDDLVKFELGHRGPVNATHSSLGDPTNGDTHLSDQTFTWKLILTTLDEVDGGAQGVDKVTMKGTIQHLKAPAGHADQDPADVFPFDLTIEAARGKNFARVTSTAAHSPHKDHYSVNGPSRISRP